MKANKALGQHWLKDPASLNTMLKAAQVSKQDTILEIGPGLGYLTEHLVQEAKQVVAVEADHELIEPLKVQFFQATNFTVEYGDILQYNLGRLPQNYKVVANIPYYLTSQLLKTLLTSTNPPSTLTLLIQKEVAERIIAQPGNMSVLALSVQYYAKANIVAEVGKELFDPPPKVDSAIIHIARYSQPVFVADEQLLFRIIKSGFSSKRKMLHNTLSAGLYISSEDIIQSLQRCHIPTTARAQELGLEQWHALYEQLVDMVK